MVEKIKKALERAYQERAGASNRSNSGLSSDTVKSVLGGSSADEILRNAKVQYIDTKRLALNRVITFDNSDAGVESYRLLRTQLIQKMQTDHFNTIGITSPNANEGKTLTSVNLAISLAKTADINVILVDGDITHPSVHEVLGLDNKWGVVDLLKGEVDLAEAVVKLNIPNLWLIPGRFENISLMDQTNAKRIEELVSALTFSDQNLVLVDLPPVLSKDDTLAISAILDGVILVVQEGSTKTDEVSRSVGLLKQGNLIGTVMNKYSRRQIPYY